MTQQPEDDARGEPSAEQIETAARALCSMKGVNPDTLYQTSLSIYGPDDGETFPEDGHFVTSKGVREPMHKSWRMQVKFVHAVASALRASPSPTGDSEADAGISREHIEAAIARVQVAAKNRERPFDSDIGILIFAALRALPPQPTGEVGELVERLRHPQWQRYPSSTPNVCKTVQFLHTSLAQDDMRLAAEMIVHLNSQITELREAAKGQLVVVNAAKARAEQAEQAISVARERLSNIEGMLEHNPDDKAFRFHAAAECRAMRAALSAGE